MLDELGLLMLTQVIGIFINNGVFAIATCYDGCRGCHAHESTAKHEIESALSPNRQRSMSLGDRSARIGEARGGLGSDARRKQVRRDDSSSKSQRKMNQYREHVNSSGVGSVIERAQVCSWYLPPLRSRWYARYSCLFCA